jgi:hypothetical protein
MRGVVFARTDNRASLIFVSTMTVLGRCVSVEDALRAECEPRACANQVSGLAQKVGRYERPAREKRLFTKIFLLPKNATQSSREAFFVRCCDLLLFLIVVVSFALR